MLKKLFKGLLVGGTLLGMVATAQAATYDINIYGASAQHKFWLNLADEFLLSPTGGNCAAVAKANYDKKHGVSQGTNCTVNGTAGHTINFRYSSQSSMIGVNSVLNGDTRSMVDVGSCTFPTFPAVGTCSSLTPTQVNLGASDVAWDEFNQSTVGYPDGHLEVDVFSGDPTTNFPLEDRPAAKPDDEFTPIVVPFGFIANDTVCKFRCVKPHVWSDASGNQIDGPLTTAAYAAINTTTHKAYSHDMWECDPTLSNEDGTNPQCIGFFKCIDDVCGGGPKAASENPSCSTASDCPDVDNRENVCSVGGWTNMTEADCIAASGTWAANPNYLAGTRCEGMPLDNINTTMAGLIFSGKVQDWCDFGPYFCCGDDTGIFAAMRHAGSGTHSTVSDLLTPYNLAQDDAYVGNLMVGDSVYPQGYNRIHFESSSDLTAAVADFAGGIGYVDADKLLSFKDITDGISDGETVGYDEADGIVGAHLLKYNGVEPTRQKIINCEYEFWSPQHCYYMNADWSDPGYAALLANLSSFSSLAANLTEANLGLAAQFWTAQAEMTKCWKVKKTNITKMIIQ